jgi:hypothetical protein
MLEHFNKGGYIPMNLHLAEVQGEGLVCYDGNHRREVLNTLNHAAVCIVDIMFNASQNDVYKAFSNLNKSVQVPAIYLEDDFRPSVKDEILDLVKSYESKYRPMLSASARCHAPHFNRDMFTDNIFNIYTHFNGLLSVSGIALLLEQLNTTYAKGMLCNAHTTYRPNVIEKCKTHNLWIFMNRSIPVEHVQKLIDG